MFPCLSPWVRVWECVPVCVCACVCVCVCVCVCLCLGICGGITIQTILVKALCRQDSMAVNFTKMKAFRRLPLVTTMRADLNKMVDTMRHIFKVHFFFCLLASRAPWFECSVSRFSSYTCKERYHKPLASCLGWEDSKEKKKRKEKKRKERKRNEMWKTDWGEKIQEKQRSSHEEWDKAKI